jgi:hypothetical protein
MLPENMRRHRGTLLPLRSALAADEVASRARKFVDR